MLKSVRKKVYNRGTIVVNSEEETLREEVLKGEKGQ